MEIVDLSLKGAKLIKPKVFADSRGFFLESFHPSLQKALGTDFVQENHSFSLKHTLRGMHFQSAPGQAKLVRVVQGEILDVIVDVRKDSKTFGKWEGVTLSGENHFQLFVPIGFAHGFFVLSESAHVLYKVSSVYNENTEKGFCYCDPEIGIEWPAPTPLLSKRDASAPKFKEVIT
jgi:dTDP-4-dehydrorhamnose 3,5-epimerase